MLRVHFTADDLARVRLAPGIDPLWELLLSVHLLAGPDGPVAFGDWRRRTRPRLTARLRMLFDLAPRWGYSVDFLTPSGGSTDLDAGIEEVLRTSHQRLRADLAQLGGPVRPWRRPLADGDPAMLRQLGRSLREYQRVALAEHWSSIRAQVDADLLGRARTLRDSGVERLLSSLHPATIR